MFDLRFHALVRKILEWADAPEMQIANEHERYILKDSQGIQALPLSHGEELLRYYIRKSYAAYFGLRRLGLTDYVCRHINAAAIMKSD